MLNAVLRQTAESGAAPLLAQRFVFALLPEPGAASPPSAFFFFLLLLLLPEPPPDAVFPAIPVPEGIGDVGHRNK